MEFLLLNIKKYFLKKGFAVIFILLQGFLCASLLYTMYSYKIVITEDSGIHFTVRVGGDINGQLALCGNSIPKGFPIIEAKSVFLTEDGEPTEIVSVICGKNHADYGVMPNNSAEEKQIVVSTSLYKKQVNIGDIIKLNDVEYNVVGLNSLMQNHFVNTSALLVMEGVEITYVADRRATVGNMEKYKDELDKIWTGTSAAVISPTAESLETLGYSKGVIVIICVFVLLFLSGTFMLYYYEMLTRQKQLKVLKIIGFSKNKITSAYIIEFFLYSLTQFGIGVGFYYIMYAIFAKNRLVGLHFTDFLIAFSGLLIIALLACVPVVKKNVKKTFSEAKAYD